MITEARLREDIKPIEGLDWITALRAPAIDKLIKEKAIQLSFFDEKDLAEITHPDYPDERLIVCRNPLLAAERGRKREELLAATERELEKITTATQRKRNRLSGKDKIGLRVGKQLNRYKMGKHFCLKISDNSFYFERDTERIENEIALDGFYVIRTSVSAETLNDERTVATYKRLSTVERAFRSLKTVDLKIRPIHHRLADRVRAHTFLCMLAYYVEWHMREALAPILFDDDDKATAEKARDSIVAPAKRSPRAKHKAASKRTDDGFPVHSLQTLLQDLATLTKNHMRTTGIECPGFLQYTKATPLQRRAFDLLKISPPR